MQNLPGSREIFRDFFERTFREDFTTIFFGGKAGIFFSAGKRSRNENFLFDATSQVNRISRGAVICSRFWVTECEDGRGRIKERLFFGAVHAAYPFCRVKKCTGFNGKICFSPKMI
jgi:hypothetical protein